MCFDVTGKSIHAALLHLKVGIFKKLQFHFRVIYIAIRISSLPRVQCKVSKSVGAVLQEEAVSPC